MKIKKNRSICIALLIICSSVSIVVAKEKITDAALLDYGICNAVIKGATNSTTTASGQLNVIENTVVKEKTEIIPLKLKTSFGIKYMVNGEPVNRVIKAHLVLIHPPIKGKTKSEADIEPKIGVERFDIYTFDEEYELVPGEWIFQVFYKKRLLIEKSFKVIREE